MPGLRDRKKQIVRGRILQEAVALFVADGIEATTMEDIAAAADVSVGTVYNYFGTKNALLIAAVSADADAMVELGESVLARPGTNPAKAVQRLFGVYLDELAEWDPLLLREVMRASFERVGGPELTAELARMDERLIAQLHKLLTGFHERGRLRPDVDPFEATLLLFSIMVTHLFIFLEGWSPDTTAGGITPEPDAAALTAQVNRQIDIAFAGLGAQSASSNEKAK